MFLTEKNKSTSKHCDMLEVESKINRWHFTQKDKKLKQISSVIKALEMNYIDSQKNDRLLLMALRMETLKSGSLETQLQKALNENKQILEMVQLRDADSDVSRICSKTNLGSSISTISLVHLQYKYEELLANHRGLLKVLEVRNNEVKKYLDENHIQQEKIQKLLFNLGNCEDKVSFLQRKISDIRRRKRQKISKLKAEKQTLALVHRRLVALLHRQCMEKNDFIESLLKTTTRSEKGLLLQEIRKNNILTYENFQLQQQLQYLKLMLDVERTESKETIRSSRISNEKP